MSKFKAQYQARVTVTNDGRLRLTGPYDLRDVDQIEIDGESVYPYPTNTMQRIRRAVNHAINDGTVEFELH